MLDAFAAVMACGAEAVPGQSAQATGAWLAKTSFPSLSVTRPITCGVTR